MTPFAADVAAARAAQTAWAGVPVRDRVRPVRRFRHLLVDHADAVCAAVAADVGRPAVEVVATDLLPTAAACRFLEREAARVLRPWRVPGRTRPTWLFGCRDVVHRRPWGVVAVVGTWNYPVFLNAGQILQAVVAGNAVVWKPSENAARTADLTRQLLVDAGFPPDLVRVLPATREAGPQVAEADVDHVVFTGSDAVGRKLAARLGERLVPSTLELSGCDAMLVLADADVKLAAKAAWFGTTLNRGQTCIAVRRVLVHRSRYAEFVATLRPLAASAAPRPLLLRGQTEQANRLVADATGRGATLLTDAGDGDVAGVRPTYLLGCPADAALWREAAFAPVAGVTAFDDVDDAVRLANASPFGLAASVFTADRAAGAAVAGRLRAGSVVVNDVLAPTAHPATPFGGRGASGWGVTQGADGLLAMTVPQAVSVRRINITPHLDDAADPDPATEQVLRGLLRASYGRGAGNWWRGVRQMVWGVRARKK